MSAYNGRRFCLRTASNVLYYTGGYRLIPPGKIWISDKQKQPNDLRSHYPFAVFVFHRVNPERDPFFPALSVQAFDAQMKHLAANYQVLALGAILERIKNGDLIEPRTVAITFDDGYQDNYIYAHPVLRKYNLPATLFAATNYIGSGDMMWNDRIALALKFTDRKQLVLPHSDDVLGLESEKEKIAALDSLLESFKPLADAEKKLSVEALLKQLSHGTQSPGAPMASWDQLRKMSQEGWEIGGHTANHVILTRVTRDEEVNEIRSCRTAIEDNLNRAARLFAYPNGKSSDYDGETKEALRALGFIGAATTESRLNSAATDVFELGRSSPWEESLPDFALKLSLRFWRPSALQN